MPERAGEDGSASKVLVGLDIGLKILALLSALIYGVVSCVEVYQKSPTKPIAGQVFYRSVPEPGGKMIPGEKGDTVMKIEVRNPGPGRLENIQLEIDVRDRCKGEVGEFVSGLISTLGPKTDGTWKWNGGHTTLEIRPDTGAGTRTMHPGDQFSIVFTSNVYEWNYKRALVCVPGGEDVEVLEKMPTPQRSAISGWLPWVSFLAVLTFLVVSAVLYILTKHLGKRDAEHREAIAREQERERLEVETGRTLQAAQLDQSLLTKLTHMGPRVEQAQLAPRVANQPETPEHLPEDDDAKPETQ